MTLLHLFLPTFHFLLAIDTLYVQKKTNTQYNFNALRGVFDPNIYLNVCNVYTYTNIYIYLVRLIYVSDNEITIMYRRFLLNVY